LENLEVNFIQILKITKSHVIFWFHYNWLILWWRRLANDGINSKKLKFSVAYEVYLVLVLKISVNVGLLNVKQEILTNNWLIMVKESGLLIFACFRGVNNKQYWFKLVRIVSIRIY
jgi:hypothetical protein